MGLTWAKIKLTRSSLMGGRYKASPWSLASPELQHKVAHAQPNLKCYERLSAVYHEYARSFAPNYIAFLQALQAEFELSYRSVLDLACGAGTLTLPLTHLAEHVIGLDQSESMLREARTRCKDRPHVQFVCADFRQFRIDGRFDAVICGSDSLNYLHEPSELGRVVERVAEHLKPGGFFLFDALDDRGMRHYSDKFIPIEWNDQHYDIVLRYDPITRVDTSLVVFGDDVELHRRIPIEPDDVLRAAHTAKLMVFDWFSIAAFGLLKYGGIRNFYILRNLGEFSGVDTPHTDR